MRKDKRSCQSLPLGRKAILYEMDCNCEDQRIKTAQTPEKAASRHYLKTTQIRMKHQMTLGEANDQKRRAEMRPVRISQQNKTL